MEHVARGRMLLLSVNTLSLNTAAKPVKRAPISNNRRSAGISLSEAVTSSHYARTV